MAIFIFELQKVIAPGVENGMRLGFVVVEGIACDDGPFEVGFFVEFESYSLFAFTFVFIGFGDFGGETDRHGRSGFVLAQAETQGAIANPLSINGQGTRECSQIALQPGVQALREGFGIDLSQKVLQGIPTGNLTSLRAFLEREAEPEALLIGQESPIALD